MKRLIALLIMTLFVSITMAQTTLDPCFKVKPPIFQYTKKDIAPAIIKCSASFLSGFVGKSTWETVSNSYPYFQAAFPHANPQYCNPALSSNNKFKNNDPLQGYNSLWSKTLGVAYSDLYHIAQTGDVGLYTFGCVFPIGSKISFRKYPGRWFAKYVTEGAVLWFCRDAGFELSRRFIYKIK